MSQSSQKGGKGGGLGNPGIGFGGHVGAQQPLPGPKHEVMVPGMKDPKGKSYRGVSQRFVKLGGSRGDQVAVLDGIKPGEEVVTSGVFKLRPGAAVNVNNKVQPANNPAPKPEDS